MVKLTNKYLRKGAPKIKSVTEGFHVRARLAWEHVILSMYKTHAVSQTLL